MKPQHRQLDWNPVDNIKALAEAAVYHWRESNINWRAGFFTVLAHVAFAKGVATLSSCRWRTLLFAGVLLYLRYVRTIYFVCSLTVGSVVEYKIFFEEDKVLLHTVIALIDRLNGVAPDKVPGCVVLTDTAVHFGTTHSISCTS